MPVYRLFLTCLLALLVQNSVAQSGYGFLPNEYREALAAGTRTLTGKPGPNYWINHSSYRIRAALNPATRMLEGEATITFDNNSPDTLQSVVLRLYQDQLKPNGIRDFQVADSLLTEGVNLYYVRLDGEEINLNDTKGGNPGYRRYNAPPPAVRRYGTNIFLQLPKALAPGGTLSVEVAWSFQVPKAMNMRMGAYGEKTFFVAYWYPQIAVYDDISGWDEYNYTGTTEMYNDFNDYDVELLMPNDMMAWATGVWQNPAEVLQDGPLSRWQAALKSDSVIRVVTEQDLENNSVLKEAKNLSWKYTATSVPDFAFALSDHYLWDAASVEVEPGRRVLIQAAYPPDANLYDRAAEAARMSVKDLSTGILSWPFPFPSVTVFNSSDYGGMEFPMIVNDGRVRDFADLVDLTYHEIAHTYFPFYMGINEKKYAWMDEGWANILPNDLIRRVAPEAREPMWRNAISVQYSAGRESELPLMALSSQTGSGYGTHAYSRPTLAYHFFRDMVGDVAFQKAMQTYIADWHGKHPVPYDFFHEMNASTGRNFDWFWKPWFFEVHAPDLALTGPVIAGKKVKLTVTNVGNLPLPVELKFTYADGTSVNYHFDASVWEKGNTTFSFKEKLPLAPVKIELGSEIIPDAHLEDNVFPATK